MNIPEGRVIDKGLAEVMAYAENDIFDLNETSKCHDPLLPEINPETFVEIAVNKHFQENAHHIQHIGLAEVMAHAEEKVRSADDFPRLTGKKQKFDSAAHFAGLSYTNKRLYVVDEMYRALGKKIEVSWVQTSGEVPEPETHFNVLNLFKRLTRSNT